MERAFRACLGCFLMIGSAALVVDACGGRTVSEGGSGTTGSGQGGYAQGGSTGRGGGRAGSSGGATAGSAGAAGSSPCGNVGCPDIACGPGFYLVLEPGACCPVCKPITCDGPCMPIRCPSGSHPETPPGQCCPSCVPDPQDACKQGQLAYFSFRSQLIDKYNSVGCKVASDCTVVYESNRCVSSCGTAFPASLANSASQNLQSFADMNCATCPRMPPPPCPAPFVYCIQNVCTLGGPPPP